jgi:hypothetical protein
VKCTETQVQKVNTISEKNMALKKRLQITKTPFLSEKASRLGD